MIIIFGPELPWKAQSPRIDFNNASAFEITFSDSLYVIIMPTGNAPTTEGHSDKKNSTVMSVHIP